MILFYAYAVIFQYRMEDDDVPACGLCQLHMCSAASQFYFRKDFWM